MKLDIDFRNIDIKNSGLDITCPFYEKEYLKTSEIQITLRF